MSRLRLRRARPEMAVDEVIGQTPIRDTIPRRLLRSAAPASLRNTLSRRRGLQVRAILPASSLFLLVVITSGADTSEALAARVPTAASRSCTSWPRATPWNPVDVGEVRSTAWCIVRAVRWSRGLRTRTDVRLRAAAVAGLDLGVALGPDDDVVRRVSRTLDTRMRGRCRSPSRVRFAANDTGPNGTARTPDELARWVTETVVARTGTETIPRFVERRVLIAVVTRQGRFGENVATGSVALLLAGIRCDQPR